MICMTLGALFGIRRLSQLERRKQPPMAAMKAWVERERAKGRSEAEMTWGNCVREIGLLGLDGLRAQ
jgi:hypothetical protein